MDDKVAISKEGGSGMLKQKKEKVVSSYSLDIFSLWGEGMVPVLLQPEIHYIC